MMQDLWGLEFASELSNMMMPNNFLFQKYQNLFLILANSEEGKHILGVKEKLPIVKLTPNTFIQDTGERKGLDRIYKGQFFCYEKMAKHLLPYLMAYESLDRKPIGTDEAIEFFASQKGLRRSKIFPQVHLDTGTYYASAADGVLLHALPATNTWSTCRSATTANAMAGTGTTGSLTFAFPFADSPYLSRLTFPTDTSGLTSDATIASASLKTYVNSKSNAGVANIAICLMTVANTTTLADTDYDGYDSLNSPSEWITRVSADLTTSAYTSFTYNATGLAAISKTGFTHNGMRSSLDIDNSSPANPGTGDVNFTFSENTGTSADPYLEVVFTLPTPGGYIHISN